MFFRQVKMNMEHIISVDTSQCNRCGLCRKDCPHDTWVIADEGARIITQECQKCGHCVAICPQNAISISGFTDAPEPLIDVKPDPETLLAMLKGRRSIRHFTQQDVPPEIVEKIIEAGRYTPTGLNRQGVSYVVLRANKDEYEKIAVSTWRKLLPIVRVFMKPFRRLQVDDGFCFKGAPVVIVIKSDNLSFGSVNIIDGALAASAMEIMARSFGLGVLYSESLTNAAKFSRKLRRKLSAGSKGKILITLVLGYPAVTYHRTAQKERPLVRYD
jgi:nitroreductase/Pyruvate/2-oxoacid:ferredoxin oxidoreductase delta subunit